MLNTQITDLFTRFSEGMIDRRKFLTGIGGTAAAATLLPLLSSPSLRAQMMPSPFTMKERDRRWARVREFMKEKGLGALILSRPSGDGHLQYADYLSNGGFFMAPGAVVFPLDGEPSIYGSPNGGPNPWITNRSLKWFEEGGQIGIGEHIVDRINELDLANSNIGVIGTLANAEGGNEFANEGLVSYATWHTITSGLPDANFIDITYDYARLISVKGEEEITAFKKAAHAGEDLHKLMMDMARPGYDAKRFRANIAEFFVMHDIRPDVQALFLRPGKISDGQVINSEYGVNHAGGYAQVTLCMAVGKVSALTEELAEVAHASLDYGLMNMKPGVTFGEIIDGMEEIVMGQGYWHGFPQVHGLRPMFMVGPVYNDAPPFVPSKTIGADVVMEEGMIISYEPGAKKGKGFMAAEVKVGCTALVTRDGVEAWNTLGQRLQRVG